MYISVLYAIPICGHMEPLLITVATVILSAVLSAEAYKLQCLTKDGALASFVVGAIVGVFGSLNAFFLLTVFTVAGFFATLRGIDKKKAAGLQEGQRGERTWKNIVGVGLPPVLVVLLNYVYPLSPELFAILFISTITVAGADTIASEVGVRDPKVYMITTFKRVEPGVNGGVSLTGTAMSTVASLLIAILGWFVMMGNLDILLLIPFVAGVVGNLMDSVFGAVLENTGYISKYTNNCSTALIGAAFGAVAFTLG